MPSVAEDFTASADPDLVLLQKNRRSAHVTEKSSSQESSSYELDKVPELQNPRMPRV